MNTSATIAVPRAVLMAKYAPGDHVKVEFIDEQSGQSEWMWVKVDHSDDESRLVFGRLDNVPVANTDLRLGMELAVSYDNIRDHLKHRVSG